MCMARSTVFAHVVDRERGDGDGRECLHLDPGPPGQLAGRGDLDGGARGAQFQVDLDRAQVQRMAQRDQVGPAAGWQIQPIES